MRAESLQPGAPSGRCAVDETARAGIAFAPFFPLGGFSPLQSDVLAAAAKSLEKTPLQLALAWLLQRSPNMLLIPGTSSVAHLAQNLEAAEVRIPAELVTQLDGIAAQAMA